MKDRKDIDKKYTWNLDVIYSNTTEFDKDYDLVIDKINSLKKYENTMMDNSDNFYNSIRLSFEIERLIDKLYCYANLSFDLDTSNNNKQELTYEEKIERIKAAGIVGLGGAGFPTHVKLSVKDSNQVQYYIVNGAECEPYLTSDYRLMLEKTDELIAGIHVLLEMFPKALCYIAIEDNKKEAIHLLKEKCKDEKRIAVKELKTKYPQGGERMLVKVLTGKTLNSKMLPLDVGCIVDNVATVIAINQAVRYNQPLISKVMTISGDGITPSNIEVPIGTSFKWIVEQLGGFKSEVQKLICGGPMMGSALIHLDIPVTKTSSSLLALVQDEVSLFEPSACIRCGRCKDVCPSLLVPQKLYQIATKNDTEAFILNGGMECIECGCCSYTCPAKRNMTQAFKKMKYLVSINKRK